MRKFLILAAGCTVLTTAAWAQSPPSTPAPAAPNPQQNAAPSGNPAGMTGDEDDDGGWRDRGWGRRGEWDRHGGWDHGRMGGRWGMHGDWERGHDRMGERSEATRSGSAFFAFRSGRSGFMVRCAPGEPMKACVDATTTLLDKVQTMRQAGPGAGPNASPTPGAGAAPGAR